MRSNRIWLTLLWLLIIIGCAEPIKDIDRTLGNLVKKSDLDGDWHMLQTVTDVPTTSWFMFIGETSRMERVRWVAQRNYWSPIVPTSTSGGGLTTTPPNPDGLDNPLAYPIIAHVDIQREYNPQTPSKAT